MPDGFRLNMEIKMTPSEFKAWFDGFTEAFNGVPTKAQWARVKERVAEIDGKPVTERVYVDRYLPSYPYWTRNYLSDVVCGTATGIGTGSTPLSVMYDSHNAMANLGRAESKLLAA